MKRLFFVLAALAICTSPAAAQDGFGLRGIGFQMGIVDPNEVDSTFGFGAFLDLGMLAPNFGFETYVDYWSSSQNFVGGDATARDVIFGARGKYLIPVNAKVQPYVGTGLGFHATSARVQTDAFQSGPIIFPAQSISDSNLQIGIDFGGGASLPVSQVVDLRAEAWYSVVSGDFSQVSLKFGMLYKM